MIPSFFTQPATSEHQSTMLFIVSIEGPLGAGKSTLVTKLCVLLREQFKGVEVLHISEPVDLWRNWHGEDVLQRAIDIKDNLMAFQTLVLATFGSALQRAKDRDRGMSYLDTLVVMERSAMTSTEVFAKIAADGGEISKGNYETLRLLRQLLDIDPDHMVLLHSPEAREELYKRVLLRDEGKTPRHWFDRVFDAHTNFIHGETLKSVRHTIVPSTMAKDETVQFVIDLLITQVLPPFFTD